MEMTKKTVMITGATSGLGRALAIMFGGYGYRVIFNGRNRKQLYSLKNLLGEDGVMVEGDFRYPYIRENIFKECVSGIDVLINNAGIYSSKTFLDFNDNDLNEVFDTNLFAHMKLTQMLHPKMNEGCKVLNILSTCAKIPKQSSFLYSISKYAFRGFNDNLTEVLKKEEKRVYGIYLGGMQTNLFRDGYKNTQEFMNPKEVAQIIYDLQKAKKNIWCDDITINRGYQIPFKDLKNDDSEEKLRRMEYE